jgi:TRAP transporter TAXI family solute receptor
MKHGLRAAALAAAMGLALAGPAAAADTYRMMTGPQGGVWVPLGGALKNLWEKAIAGVSIQNLPGAGIANVRAIEEGKAEIGFGNSISTVDGVAGRPPFPAATKNVCNLATLYPQYFQIVALANAGVNSVKDLKGKSIAVQPRGNTAEIVTQDILKANGLSYNDAKINFQASYTDAVSLMKDGHAQVFTLGTTVPASSVMDLAAGRDVKLLDLGSSLGDMKKINPGYTLVTIKAGTYPKQDKDVKVIGYATHLVVSCKLPEAQVYAMAKMVADNVKDLSAVNKDIAALTPKMMSEDIGVPMHPGATKFYKEVKAIN